MAFGWVRKPHLCGGGKECRYFYPDMYPALPTFWFCICPARCRTRMSPGDGWGPVTRSWGQQAACFSQNTGLLDFRLWNQTGTSAGPLWAALIMASSQGKLLLAKHFQRRVVNDEVLGMGALSLPGPASGDPLCPAPLPSPPGGKFPGSTGARGPGGSQSEAGCGGVCVGPPRWEFWPQHKAFLSNTCSG